MSNASLRVILLTTSFPLNPQSVSGIFVRRLVESLPDSVHVTVVTPCSTSPVSSLKGYDIHCFRYAPWKWQILAHQPGGIPVAVKRSKMIRWLLPIFILSMIAACFREFRSADIVHANWSVNGAIAGVVGFVMNKPVVTTLRGEDVTRAKSSRVYRWLLDWCLRSNRKLITVSEAIHDLLSREYPAYQHKIVFQPNGVDDEFMAASVARGDADKNEVFKLLCVGSLIPRKGVDTIIDALACLDSPAQFRLTIVGDGPEKSALEKQARERQLNDCVEFVGQVSPDKVVDYLKVSDALVLASYSEGRPNVVLESFACGVPVIASDIEGVRELLGDDVNGLKFLPGNEEDLAVKMTRLRESDELKTRLAENARSFIVDNRLFWRDVGFQYFRIYKMALED